MHIKSGSNVHLHKHQNVVKNNPGLMSETISQCFSVLTCITHRVYNYPAFNGPDFKFFLQNNKKTRFVFYKAYKLVCEHFLKVLLQS